MIIENRFNLDYISQDSKRDDGTRRYLDHLYCRQDCQEISDKNGKLKY